MNAHLINIERWGSSAKCYQTIDVSWIAPPTDWIKINTDGAVKQGAGFMGYSGGLIRNGFGDFLRGFSHTIGVCSVFEAELWGVFDGFCTAWEMGVKRVIVETDNKTVVNMILDEQQLHSPTLLICIKAKVKRDWEVKIQHVYREGNNAADFLANFATRMPFGIHVIKDAPAGLLPILVADSKGRDNPENRSLLVTHR